MAVWGWRGKFYPQGLAQRRELEYASRRFNSIELNGSFYSLQRPQSFETWYNETPEGFVFAVKGSRFVTHMLKLRRVEVPLANFFAQGLLRLKEKLGPILWQFPAQFKCNPNGWKAFFRSCRARRKKLPGWLAVTTSASTTGIGIGCSRIVRCATPSRFAMIASCAKNSSRFCESTTSGLWSPTR